MCINRYTDTYIGMGMDICKIKCTIMCIDMCIDVYMRICNDVRVETYGYVYRYGCRTV